MPNDDRPCARSRDLVLLHFGELDAARRDEMRAHLRDCTACRAEMARLEATLSDYAAVPVAAPGPQRYAEMVARATRTAPGAVAARPPVRDRRWAVAAVVVLALAVGVVAGRWLLPYGSPPAPTASDPETVSLRSSLAEGSPHERLRAAVAAAVLSAPSEEIFAALIEALRTDPSVNVRLAVVDALRELPPSSGETALLLDSLGAQSEPLLRKALIELYVARDIREAEPLLRTVAAGDPEHSVRERARWALEQLS